MVETEENRQGGSRHGEPEARSGAGEGPGPQGLHVRCAGEGDQQGAGRCPRLLGLLHGICHTDTAEETAKLRYWTRGDQDEPV